MESLLLLDFIRSNTLHSARIYAVDELKGRRVSSTYPFYDLPHLIVVESSEAQLLTP